MWRGFRWLALAGVVAVAALVGPPAALACDNSSSAVNIYVECNKNAGGTHSRTPSSPSSTTTPYVAPQPTISHRTRHALKHAGKDGKALIKLMGPKFGNTWHLKAALTSSPTTLGSAFDLGSGPTTLLVLLFGTVLSLLGTSGFRAWRNRHRA